MKITAVKTENIGLNPTSLPLLCDRYLTHIPDRSILAITSKIVSICEGSVISDHDITRNDLASQEADAYIDPSQNKYNYMITVKNNKLVASSGIDNGTDAFILWPKDAQASANLIRNHVTDLRIIKRFGVIITDTHSAPFMKGTIGFTLAHSGFLALNDYRGKTDAYNGVMCSTVVNVAEALAAAAVLTMGEGDELTPLAIIEDVPFVEFQGRSPTDIELKELSIAMEDDLFAPLLLSAPWQSQKKERPS